jgi:hypothetical protein
MDTPPHVTAGILLERSQLLLPWRANLESLLEIGDPIVSHQGPDTHVTWEDELVLGGLSANVSISKAQGPDYYSLGLRTQYPDAREEFRALDRELVGRMGPPHIAIQLEGYPWHGWRWGDVQLVACIGERFTEYVSLVIAKGRIQWPR